MQSTFTNSKLLAAAILSTAFAAPIQACDTECEGRIDDLSAQARSADQSVAQGRNSSVILKYGAGVPVLKCRPLNFCSLQLQPGEVPIEDITLADTVLWSAEVRVSGGTANPQVRIIVKPDTKATQTSMVVATDKRFYDIQLVKSDTDYTQVLAFTYPAEIAASNAKRIAALSAKKAAAQKKSRAAAARKSIPVGKRKVQVGALSFDYQISGKATFKPTRVFNDGRKTYIDLPESYRSEKPIFLSSGSSGSNEIVNSRWSGNRLTIDRVVSGGTLILGVGNRAKKITIKRR